MTCLDTYYVIIMYISTTVSITQGNYVGYMFRLFNSHLQAYFLQVKSQDAVHTLLKYSTDVNTLGSQCVHSIM